MFLYFALFCYGLVFGSFINAFLWRLKIKKSLSGRSICPECKHKILWYDNIPLLSFFLLRGRCRNCHNPISISYPIIELLTALAFVTVGASSDQGRFINSGLLRIEDNWLWILNVLSLIALLATSVTFIIIAVYDQRTKEIPNGLSATLALLSLFYLGIGGFTSQANQSYYLNHLLSGFFMFIFFFAIVYLSNETWMGGGDAKIAFSIGVLLGYPESLLAVMLASIIGSIYGLLSIFLSRIKKNKLHITKKVTLKSEIPFGPFLVIGTFIVLVIGRQLISFYVTVILGI